MPPFDDTDMGGKQRSFPTTHWSLLGALRGETTPAHRAVLNLLLGRYWKPVYCYLRRQGYNDAEAKDLTQEFFTSCLVKKLFGKADPAKGRFRTFLLSSLENFLKNVHRKAHAKRRRPPGGFVLIDETATDEDKAFVPPDESTPEDVFNQTWARELVLRVLKNLEDECRNTDKEKHYELFRQRIMLPILEGKKEPALEELAKKLGLGEKQASNYIITARRAYQRLLRDEIRIYAASEEDLSQEIQDLFQLLHKL